MDRETLELRVRQTALLMEAADFTIRGRNFVRYTEMSDDDLDQLIRLSPTFSGGCGGWYLLIRGQEEFWGETEEAVFARAHLFYRERSNLALGESLTA